MEFVSQTHLYSIQLQSQEDGTQSIETQSKQLLKRIMTGIQTNAKVTSTYICTKDTLALFSITMIGKFDHVQKLKTTLVLLNPSQAHITLKALRGVVLDSQGEMKALVKKRLDEVKVETDTLINCSSLDDGVDIDIIGSIENTEKARLMVLRKLDELVKLH